MDEVREQADSVCATQTAERSAAAPGGMPHDPPIEQPSARQIGSHHIILVALTLGLLMALISFVLDELPGLPDTDLSLEAEQMNALAPAAGSAEQPSEAADSFVNPDRLTPAPRLGPADTLEPLQPRFR